MANFQTNQILQIKLNLDICAFRGNLRLFWFIHENLILRGIGGKDDHHPAEIGIEGKTVKKSVLMLTVFLLFVVGQAVAEDKKSGDARHLIKIGTVVPEMGSFGDMMVDFKKEISDRTNDHLRVIIYFGGVMGDEVDIVRKMRLGQLQAGGMTLLGLGQIVPSAKVLQLPFLFNDYDEVDYILKKMRPAFTRLFEEKGVYLLGWYDMGFGYFYFQNPVDSFADIQKTKMVSFVGDPVFAECEKAYGFENLIPLTIAETLGGLRTQLINGTFSPFFALVGLQWNSHVKYVLNVPTNYSIAAIVGDKKAIDALPPQLREVLFDTMLKRERPLSLELRKMENETYASLLKRGLVEISPDKAKPIIEEMKQKSRYIYDKYADDLYPSWLLAGILNHLAVYRSEKAAPQ